VAVAVARKWVDGLAVSWSPQNPGVVAGAGTGLALRHAGEPGPLLVLAAVAAVLALASVVPRASVDRPRWAQRRRRLEAAAVLALVPLLAGVLGVFGAVVDLARSVE